MLDSHPASANHSGNYHINIRNYLHYSTPYFAPSG